MNTFRTYGGWRILAFSVLLLGFTLSAHAAKVPTTLGFEHGESDASALTLQAAGEEEGTPGVVWGTYLGGSDDDHGGSVAVDSSGNVYAIGYTSTPGWTSGGWDTTLDGYPDAYVVKLSQTGAHLWSTYVGGAGVETGTGIAVDPDGNVYAIGRTTSLGWVSGGWSTTIGGDFSGDGYLVKLSSTGDHLWSTYLYGPSTGVAVDSSGNVYVTGETFRPGWTSGGWDTILGGDTWTSDGYVVKFSPTGAHLWSTYLGGTNSDYGNGIAVDSNGNVLITGFTKSSDWVNGGWDTSYNDSGNHDAFVVKLSALGMHVWSTYLGGTGCDDGCGIAVDSGGNVYAVGSTTSSGWVSGGWSTIYDGGGTDDRGDAFVAKLSAAGAHVWSSYLGGADFDSGRGIAVDTNGYLYVTGVTRSSDWVSGGWDTTLDGYPDAYVVKLSQTGEQVWSSYLGGADSDYGQGIAVDGNGYLYVTGTTLSSDWLSGGWDTTFGGGSVYDAYVVRVASNLPVDYPVSITVQPQSATANPGAAVSFSVTATGTPTLSYQWKKDGADTADATNATYSIASAQQTDEGSYTCAVSNVVGSVTSDAATLNVSDPPQITSHPRSLTVNPGASASFAVEANGTSPLSFQWKKNGGNVSGATLSQYAIASAMNSYEGAYACYVWNVAGSATSNAATLTVNDPPQITAHPQSLTVNPGTSASFAVEANGTSPLSFQWKKDGVNVSGATLNQYVIASALNSYEGAYACYVWNVAGSATSNAATLTVNDPPVITGHPQSTTVTAGSSAAFAVDANGSPPLNYQWQKGGTDISGATLSSYAISGAQASDAGSYVCVVSNMAGIATSNAATLTVNPATQPPVADFGASPRTGNAPLEVQFTDYTDYKGRTPQSWSWTFGDGGTSTQQSPSHTYQVAGTYTVSLTVTTDGGSDTETKANYISVSAPPPVVDFTGSPLWGVAPLTVNFTDATLTYGQTVLSRLWTFGDGGTSTQQNPSRTYQASGRYSVALTVTTGAGSDTLTKVNYITVSGTGEGISMWIPDRSALKGKDVVIPLNMSAPDGVILKGVQIEFYYDAAILDPTTVQVQSTALTGRMSFASNVSTPGRVIVNVMGATGEIRGVGHLFDVVGRIRSNAVAGACGELGFDAVFLYDQNVNPLPVDYTDTGNLCVEDNCMFGDLNGNGAVEIGDALRALEIAVKKREMDACSLKSGDLNGDNVIDSADAVMLQRLAVGMRINPTAATKAGEVDPMLLGVILEGTDYVMVSLEGGAAPVGTNVDVPIWIDNPQGLSGFDVWISYPPELTPLEKFSGTVLSGGQIDYKAGDGMVNVSMGRKEGVSPLKSGPGTLATVRFYVNAMPEGGKAELRIEKCALKGQYGDSFAWYTAVQKINANIAVREGEGDEPGCFGGTLDGTPPAAPSSGANGLIPLALVGVALALASRRGVRLPSR